MGEELTQSKYRMLRPVKDLHHHLLRWFDEHKREMPWRATKDPYAIWLSETMLQQTQVETVKPFYRKFLAAFPTVGDLARADLQEVLTLWAGLGYYRRAKHLHLAAKKMVEAHGGKVPGDVESLLSLPGIGRYTAGAVASIAFGVEVPVVDGNVMRVLARLTGFNREISERASTEFFWGLMTKVVAGARKKEGKSAENGGKLLKTVDVVHEVGGGRFGDVNQAVMELGATVCVPVGPRCGECPVRGFCVANKEGSQGELPVKRRKGAVPVVRGVAIVVTRNSKYKTQNTKPGGSAGGGEEVLLMQRGVGGVWEGMWEFPVVGEGKANGKNGEKTSCVPVFLSGNEGGRMEISCVPVSFLEGLGVRVGDMWECGEVVHVLTHRRMELRVVRVVVETQNTKLKTQNKEGEVKTQNSKRKTQNQDGDGVRLPVGVDGVGVCGDAVGGVAAFEGWGVAAPPHGAGGLEGGGEGGGGLI